jgi:glutamyl-tRNA synthetase
VSGPRVRFAPAPTGYLHVGSARAALFNWLFARSQGGELVLRIEDTDAERNRPELIDAIVEALEWLGIDWDEGPIHQSGRMDLYRDAAARLLADGRAYLVDADNEPVEGTELQDGHALRFRVGDEGATGWDDVIRGHVSFEHENLEDFVVWRSNGTPTFLLANAVDDADMGITHIIRGEDLVSATPKILMIREALGGGELPVFAHLPLLVNEQRKKLSKRRDDVSVGDYRERGYLPGAMANYLALLGWGPPDGVEIRPMSEIVELFRLEDVNQAAAFFDIKKLTAFNAEYLRAMSPTELLERAQPWLTGPDVPWSPEEYDAERMGRVTPLIQQRVRILADVPASVDFFFGDPEMDEAVWDKEMVKGRHVPEILDDAIAQLTDCEWDADVLSVIILGFSDRFEINKKRSQMPVRVAVTGRSAGPPLWQSLIELGRDEVLARLRSARARL